MAEPRKLFDLSFLEEHYPSFDPAHATPDPMVRRVVVIRSEKGDALFEQTDYGHPGRFNDWSPRGIAPALQPRADELREICEQIGSLLG